jgi:hypothetical protein
MGQSERGRKGGREGGWVGGKELDNLNRPGPSLYSFSFDCLLPGRPGTNH